MSLVGLRTAAAAAAVSFLPIYVLILIFYIIVERSPPFPNIRKVDYETAMTSGVVTEMAHVTNRLNISVQFRK